MITVFIIAPTPTLRAGLRAMLAEGGFQVVGEATGVGVAPAADVVVVAEDQAAGVGLILANAAEGTALVALSSEARLVAQLRAMPLHGWALAAPEASPDELHAAVYAAVQGYIAVPRALADAMPGPRNADDPPAEALTARETEVLGLISQGLPNKQIALRLAISEHTVKFHIAAIFAKLGAASRTEAVRIGARQGLIIL